MTEKQKTPLIERAILISEKIENLFFVRVIRDGLVTMIPILMIGAFALVLQSFPLSKSLSIDCLAEYVENEDIRRILHTIGCDQYQGYLFSKAVPLDK